MKKNKFKNLNKIMTSKQASSIYTVTSNVSKLTRTSKGSSKTTTMRADKIPVITKESPQKEKIEAEKISKKELEMKEYEEVIRKQKLKEQLEEKKYRNISVRISSEENILCLSVDGSQTSKDAFEIILTEFLPYIHDSVMICPHIFNTTMDEKFNWRYQKANVLQYFKTRLTTSLADYQGYLIIQDRDQNKMHEIEQSYKICEMNQCKYFFCGYEGLREQALKRSRIDVGIEYLLSESKIPVFVMKDNKKRGNKNKGFQWLLVMDKSNSDCYKVLDLFLPLIDKKVDKIYGLTLLPHFVKNDDDVKQKFYEKMKELNFKEKEQFEYSSKQYESNPSQLLVNFVNHNSELFFDFVLFLNNPMKFKTQKQECDSFKYVKLLYANIGFCNYAYLHGYDYKQISKLPNEIDPRKYLDKIKKPETQEVQEALNIDAPTTFKEKEIREEKKIEINYDNLNINKILEDKNNNNENKENNDNNKENYNDNGEIYSEIYGVSKGEVFERVSPVKPKKGNNNNAKKLKIVPKNLAKVSKDVKETKEEIKKRKSWAPTSFKKKFGEPKNPGPGIKRSINVNYNTIKAKKKSTTKK